MRGISGTDVKKWGRGNGRLVRMVAGLLVVLSLLVSSGVGAVADESHGIDLPFTSRDDDGAESGTPAAGAEGSAFALTAFVCTPGDDADLRDRMLVESSTGLDAFFGDGIEPEELREVCAPPEEALTYTLADSGGDVVDTRDLGGPEDAAYTWTNLSSTGSMYTLGVDMPETYADPIVTCTIDGEPPGALTQYFATGGTIRFYNAIDQAHTCEWFNVDLGAASVGQGAATPVATEEEGAAAISVRAYTCALGDDPDLLGRVESHIDNVPPADPAGAVSLAELHEACDAPAEEITFTVTNQDTAEGEERVLGGEFEGYATWEMDAHHIHSVDAGEPEGYGAPIVFCALGDGEPSQSQMLDGVLYVAFGAGVTFTCDWFNVDPEGASDGADEATGGQTGDSDDATATTGAEDGNFALRAYTCSPGDDAALRARLAYQIENWTTVDPAEGITIDELREVCEPADGSIPISVTEDETGDTEELMVGGEDSVSVPLTPLASYTIAADEPDGYGEPIVFCALDDGAPSQSPLIEGNLFHILGEGVTESCEWFHVDLGGVPLDEPSGDDENVAAFEDVPVTESDVVTAESSAISIRSYTCTPAESNMPDLLERIDYQRENWIAVDPYNGITLIWLRDNCEPTPDEIAFVVTDQDSSEQVKKVIGGAENDGYVTWEVVPDAGNTVDADEPDGYVEPLVFCAFHDTGEPAEDLTPSPMTDGLLNVGMSAGTTYTCDWFHVDTGAAEEAP